MKERKSPRRIAAELLESNTLFWTVVVKYNAISAHAQLTGKSKRLTVLSYPEKPKPYHVLYKICHILGWRLTNDPRVKADRIIHFEDTTVRAIDPTLQRLSEQQRVYNLHSNDISKQHVDHVFKEVFGYGTIVDPRTHHGVCVKKSDDNAKHYGVVMECPAEPEAGFVYQKVINNRHGGAVLDIRVPIMDGVIPFVYEKYRPIGKRFENVNTVANLVDARDALNSDEMEHILQFSKKFGLDYGELDVLRDQDDGKIYIVDVNNTPAGPPNHISKAEHRLALAKLTEAFQACLT